MGGTTFDMIVIGRDPAEAFNRAREDAAYEHGHGGYTGTIAEKPGFTIIQNQPVSQSEAYALMSKLLDDCDPRVDDKWGNAGAIPVVLETREVRVGPFDYTLSPLSMSIDRSVEENLLAAVTPLVKVRKGETIEAVRPTTYETPGLVHSRGYGGFSRGPERRTNCYATVTIRKPPFTREVEFTVTLPNLVNRAFPGAAEYPDHAAIQKALTEHAASNVRLKQGERLVSVIQQSNRPGKSKVTAVAPKDKTETRFIVKPSREHGSWENGFGSQAEARAWATNRAGDLQEGVVFEIESVTRRASGAPLVMVQRLVADREHTATAIVSKDVTAEAQGWLFFGWAST